MGIGAITVTAPGAPTAPSSLGVSVSSALSEIGRAHV